MAENATGDRSITLSEHKTRRRPHYRARACRSMDAEVDSLRMSENNVRRRHMDIDDDEGVIRNAPHSVFSQIMLGNAFPHVRGCLHQ